MKEERNILLGGCCDLMKIRAAYDSQVRHIDYLRKKGSPEADCNADPGGYHLMEDMLRDGLYRALKLGHILLIDVDAPDGVEFKRKLVNGRSEYNAQPTADLKVHVSKDSSWYCCSASWRYSISVRYAADRWTQVAGGRCDTNKEARESAKKSFAELLERIHSEEGSEHKEHKYRDEETIDKHFIMRPLRVFKQAAAPVQEEKQEEQVW